MQNTPHQKLFFAVIFSLSLVSNSCFAWDGIDPKKNSIIQIETGNLVREGSVIDFYDSADGNYHTGRVLIMNAVSHGTELTVEDFTAKHQERFFLMSEE